MLNIEYCSATETLKICSKCERNDKNRKLAIDNTKMKSRVKMTVARPVKSGGNEECDMFREGK